RLGESKSCHWVRLPVAGGMTVFYPGPGREEIGRHLNHDFFADEECSDGVVDKLIDELRDAPVRIDLTLRRRIFFRNLAQQKFQLSGSEEDRRAEPLQRLSLLIAQFISIRQQSRFLVSGRKLGKTVITILGFLKQLYNSIQTYFDVRQNRLCATSDEPNFECSGNGDAIRINTSDLAVPGDIKRILIIGIVDDVETSILSGRLFRKLRRKVAHHHPHRARLEGVVVRKL